MSNDGRRVVGLFTTYISGILSGIGTYFTLSLILNFSLFYSVTMATIVSTFVGLIGGAENVRMSEDNVGDSDGE